MKYKCANCGHISEFEYIVPVVKCVDCEHVTVYTRNDLTKIMEECDEA